MGDCISGSTPAPPRPPPPNILDNMLSAQMQPTPPTTAAKHLRIRVFSSICASSNHSDTWTQNVGSFLLNPVGNRPPPQLTWPDYLHVLHLCLRGSASSLLYVNSPVCRPLPAFPPRLSVVLSTSSSNVPQIPSPSPRPIRSC